MSNLVSIGPSFPGSHKTVGLGYVLRFRAPHRFNSKIQKRFEISRLVFLLYHVARSCLWLCRQAFARAASATVLASVRSTCLDPIRK